MTYIFSIIFFLISCDQASSTNRIQNIGSAPIPVISDTLKNTNNKIERKIVPDSLINFDVSFYSLLKPKLYEISKNEFQSYKEKYKTSFILNSGQFIKGSNIYVTKNCNEICETFLAERNTNRKMLLPSNYDAGILKIQLSPSCKQFIVCSSYDGTDYESYYEHRAELFIFNITKETGLKSIKPMFKYYTKDWSIKDLTWVNEKTIALKIYKGNKTGDKNKIAYKYLIAKLNKKE